MGDTIDEFVAQFNETNEFVEFRVKSVRGSGTRDSDEVTGKIRRKSMDDLSEDMDDFMDEMEQRMDERRKANQDE